MRFVNVPISVARTPELAGATDAQVGRWFRLQIYCTEQLNNGMIKGCDCWPAETFPTIFGCTKAALQEPSPLWYWRAGTIIVEHYNLEAEQLYLATRKGGQSKSAAKVEAAIVNGKKGGAPRKFVQFPAGVSHQA